MKGSVLLFGLFALFYIASSDAFSVRFVSEENETTTRQGDLTTHTTTTSRSSLKSEDNGNTAEGGKAVRSEDVERSNAGTDNAQKIRVSEPSTGLRIRKRDVHNVVRLDNPQISLLPPAAGGHNGAIKWIKLLGLKAAKCIRDLVNAAGLIQGADRDRAVEEVCYEIVPSLLESISQVFVNTAGTTAEASKAKPDSMRSRYQLPTIEEVFSRMQSLARSETDSAGADIAEESPSSNTVAMPSSLPGTSGVKPRYPPLITTLPDVIDEEEKARIEKGILELVLKELNEKSVSTAAKTENGGLDGGELGKEASFRSSNAEEFTGDAISPDILSFIQASVSAFFKPTE